MTATVRDALIVAGGRGTRLQPLTYTTRKELLPLCGVPFLAGVVARLVEAGVTRVWLVVGADTRPFAQLREAVADVELRVVPEPTPLDTAGGVRSVASQLSETALVLNGDVLTDVDYAAVVAHHRSRGADATIVLTEVEDTSSYGVCVLEGTRIVRFVEKPPAGTLPHHRTVNAGTYVIEPGVLLRHPEGRLSFERQVFPELLVAGGHLEGFRWDGIWADLGTPERFRRGHRLALDGKLRWPAVEAVPEVASGIRIDPTAAVARDADLRAPVLVLADAVIEDGAEVGPHVVVGRRAVVGSGTAISDSVLFDDVVIGAELTVDGLIAGFRSRVDSGAVIGHDVVLGDDEKVKAGVRLTDGTRIPPPVG